MNDLSIIVYVGTHARCSKLTKFRTTAPIIIVLIKVTLKIVSRSPF